MSELSEYVKEQLKLHGEILAIVKEHVDRILREVFGIDPAQLRSDDPSTYYAITMELARSIFVNYSVEKRRRTSGEKRWQKQ